MDKAIPEFTKHEGLRLMNAESTNAALRLMDAMRDPVKMERKAASEILHRLRTAATDYRPGNAIAIMDASGEAIINNNFINGILCLYGIEPIGGFPRPEEAVSFVKAFQGKYRELMSFREATNTLYLQGNSITAVYSGIMAEIVKNPELLHGITGVFLRGVILGNQVEGPDNVFFARNLYFTSNSFGQHCSPIGAAIGETIIFTGNHAIQPRAVFYNFCNGEKVGVANPGINFNP